MCTQNLSSNLVENFVRYKRGIQKICRIFQNFYGFLFTMNLFFNITSITIDAFPQAVFSSIYTIFETFCRLISKQCFCCMFCFISVIESAGPIKFKSERSVNKVMATVFWDQEGVVPVDCCHIHLIAQI